MPRRQSPAPKHRTPALPAAGAARRGRLLARVLSLVAGAAAGTALVASGAVLAADAPREASTGTETAALAAADPPSRAELDALVAERAADTTRAARVSRSTLRVARRTELQALDQLDPRDVAKAMLARSGFGTDQFGCLDALWAKESGWNPTAANPSSSAYGIPQALPGSKMASAGADWETNPATQIRWGLGYIRARYGTPCAAWSHSQSSGWY